MRSTLFHSSFLCFLILVNTALGASSDPRVTFQGASTEDNSSEKLGEIFRDPDGSVSSLNQYEAAKECIKQGFRLPTLRELAAYAQQYGAQGTLETEYPEIYIEDTLVKNERQRMLQKGYWPVLGKSPSGILVVDFYFSTTGYERPSMDEGKYLFWASGIYPDSSKHAYTFNGITGTFSAFPRKESKAGGYFTATRCFESH